MNLGTFRPRYLVARVQQLIFERQFPDAPWLTRSSIMLLDSWLRSTDVGFEWGSGRSTLWFANRVSHFVSVETSKEWFDKITVRLKAGGLSEKVDYRYMECDIDEREGPLSLPYADTILSFDDNHFDFVLVDGMARASCARNALAKIKPGGLLIIDNANRYFPSVRMGKFTTVHEQRSSLLSPVWEEVSRPLHGWRAIHTSDGICDTRMWQKPFTHNK